MDAIHPMDAKELEEKIQKTFPPPQVLDKILHVVNDPNSSAYSIEQVFKYDPTFTLKILNRANSSYYGSTGRITNIRAAITLLGIDMLRSLALQAGASELFSFNTEDANFTGYDLWKHSIGVGVCAKTLSRRLGLDRAEDYFTLGLLHDVGLMIEYQFYPQVFTAFLQESKTSTENPIALERSYYGWDHADISARLCEAWKINPDFIIPIRHHHTPWDAPESYRFSACLIDVANQIVKKSGFGFVNPMPYSLQAPVLDLLQLQPIDLEVLQEDFEKEIQEVFQFFNQL